MFDWVLTSDEQTELQRIQAEHAAVGSMMQTCHAIESVLWLQQNRWFDKVCARLEIPYEHRGEVEANSFAGTMSWKKGLRPNVSCEPEQPNK